AWIIYDLMCKSPLVHNKKLFALIGFMLLIALAYGLTQLLSARAAFIHIGALIGINMVLNVFFVIIPAQKTMVAAALKGEKVDPSLGAKALTRSIHNNYMTLPVLFIMISNHFPSTFGNKHSWLVLAGLILVGASVRHWFNLKGKKITNYWLLPFAIALLVALVIYTKPASKVVELDNTITVSDIQAMQMIDKHCTSCHASKPTSTIFAQAPKGLSLENLAVIQANKETIQAQTVNSHLMPLGNTTKMTEQERQMLGQWLEKQL
ncbi:MAG: urate hydroxylase PuuD, partial [Proteobacteria bacterium]|nr:urate hydroxylase PuuD [Pseudomonadota bacterium]